MTPPDVWSARRQPIGPAVGEKVMFLAAGRALTFAQAIAGWAEDETFRAFVITALAASPYPAFFWEMPPIRRGWLDKPYEYVAMNSKALARLRPDPGAFLSQLEAPGDSGPVRSFRNLGGDAVLVAPRPLAGREAYGHMGAFVRLAPIGQRHALFQALAREIAAALDRSDQPLWISTAGLGVPWLHVRLDSWPKYYTYRPYREA